MASPSRKKSQCKFLGLWELDNAICIVKIKAPFKNTSWPDIGFW